jgi:hypothetical protein
MAKELCLRGTPNYTLPGVRSWAVRVVNWLHACVSLRRSQNIKGEERRVGRVLSALNQRAGECAGAIRSAAVLDSKTCRDALDSSRTLIHVCLFGEPKIRAKNGLFHKIQNQMDHFVGRQRSPRRGVRCRSSGTPAKCQAARFWRRVLVPGPRKMFFTV